MKNGVWRVKLNKVIMAAALLSLLGMPNCFSQVPANNRMALSQLDNSAGFPDLEPGGAIIPPPTTIKSIQTSGSGFGSGFTMPCWWKDCYSLPKTIESLTKLSQTGARWVVLTPTWFMNAASDSYMQATDGTPTDDSLRVAIRKAKSLGLLVSLKPHVDVKNDIRFNLNPADQKAWFKSYRVMVLQYARLAAAEKVDIFVVGTELFHVDGPTNYDDWKSLIAAVRAVYSGSLTYAADWYNFPRVTFWDQLDYIGIDCYFPQVSSYYIVMQAGWQSYKLLVAPVAALYGKQVIFTELGISSQEGANRQPWEWKEIGPVDLKVQSDYFESLLSVFGDTSWFAGFWQWGWEINPDGGGANDKGMTVQGKPALDVLIRHFTAAANKLASCEEASVYSPVLPKYQHSLFQKHKQLRPI